MLEGRFSAIPQGEHNRIRSRVSFLNTVIGKMSRVVRTRLRFENAA